MRWRKSPEPMSDAYLLDTNVICTLADVNRVGHAAATLRLQRVTTDFVLLPSMAVAEIEFGMARAANVRPEKREELRGFIARFDQLPFDESCIKPYSFIRAELWRANATLKAGRPQSAREKRPEDLVDKVTGRELGIDEPDLIIASIALAQNLVLVTDDGMERIKEAAESTFRNGDFPVQLRNENWLSSS
jgi:predicted nucleic acid-binding protein